MLLSCALMVLLAAVKMVTPCKKKMTTNSSKTSLEFWSAKHFTNKSQAVSMNTDENRK